ncbi:transcriptional regulator, partial [Streptomyces sp. ST2-7A]|nr:transcriptional regulator [Streptomyces sp. ST2-7A]
MFEDTRKTITTLLLERAATTSELAAALGKPKGTVGHHLKVLEEAGLVRVVRTERVRALEAKYYGRTARTFLYHYVNEAVGEPQRVLTRAAAEIAAVPPPPADGTAHEGPPLNANLRYARIPAERAQAWSHRLNELLDEFTREPAGGGTTFGLALAIYPTDRTALPKPPTADESDETGGGA